MTIKVSAACLAAAGFLLLAVSLSPAQDQIAKSSGETVPDLCEDVAEPELTLSDQYLEAARSGSLKKVKAALEDGINVNAQNASGESALHLVTDPATAAYLIERGADVHLRDKDFGMTPLFFQGVPIARLLVAAGADVNARSFKGNTPLIWFSYGNDLEGVQYLVSVGADTEAVNSDGQTALDVAKRFGNLEVAGYLISLGLGRKHRK